VLDSAGPSRWTFEAFVRLIARAVGSRAWIGRAPPEIALVASCVAGFALRDVLLTGDEMGALMAGLIVSSEEPRGSDRFDAWVADNAPRVGRRYTSELARNFG
jgi:hypothetical protein